MTKTPLRLVDPLLSEEATGAVRDLLLETRRPPRLSLRNRAYYHVRPFIPLALRQFLQHASRPRAVPEGWWLDPSLLRAYAAHLPQEGRAIVAPWPDGARLSLVLTHDVETAEGFAAMEPVLRLEERLGVRSSWNLVAHKYAIDWGRVEELKARGFEIGVHGYNHDGTLYFSRRRFRRRVAWINAQAVPRMGAVGFRSPAAHRNLEWLQDVDAEYDASCFDVDPFQPMPGGTGSLWPFVAGKLVELPYTLPQDHVLSVVLRQGSNEIWKRKTRWLSERHGLACLVTHPDYLRTGNLLRWYEDFLEWVLEERGVWTALPAEAATWWRQRADSRVASGPSGPRVEGPAASRARPLRVRPDGASLAFAEV